MQSAKRYRTTLRGWEANRKLFLVVAADAEKIPARMMNQEAVFRFLHEGHACAFKATVIRGTSAESGRFGEIQVAWPENIETVQVRRSPRVNVDYPCTLHWGGCAPVLGTILDLSEGGCSIELVVETPPCIGADVELAFRLPGELPVTDISATVKSLIQRGEAWRLGCEFRKMDDVTAGNIRLTVVEVLSSKRSGGCTVVVLSESTDNLREMIASLRTDGIESMVAVSILSIGYLLLSRQVNALVIFDGAREITTLDLCRLVRATPRIEGLPILVVGEVDRENNACLMSAGATACIPWTDAHAVAGEIRTGWVLAAAPAAS